MKNDNTAAQKQRALELATVAAALLFAVSVAFILMVSDGLRNRRVLETTQQYMTFESKVERLIYGNVILLEGFDAYLSTHATLDGDDAYRYLGHLLEGNLEYIRNFGVVEDTTIIWNYPNHSSNNQTIGTDLAQVPAQRAQVLQVKERGTPLMHGPIPLVQGESGFSVRSPILRDGVYWGQTSIVLRTDKVLEAVDSYAKSAGIAVAIYNREDPEPFYTATQPGHRYLEFDMDPAFINWRVCVQLPEGNSVLLAVLFLLAMGISWAGGSAAYRYLQRNYSVLNMSTHDHLTGLFNRHSLSQNQALMLAQARREGHQAAMVLLDLNGFKYINDTYGHGVGDKVLVETARILEKSTRAEETIFRLGGDEFLILIPKIDGEQGIRAIRERLTLAFAQEFEVPGYPIRVVFGLGYSIFPWDGEDFESLLREADRRMYQDKSGKGTAPVPNRPDLVSNETL